MAAPVVPKMLAMTAPVSRSVQLASGVARRDTWMTMPPLITNRANSRQMKLTYSCISVNQ